MSVARRIIASPQPRPAAAPPAARAEVRFVAYKWTLAVLTGAICLAVYDVIGFMDLPRSTTLLDTRLDRAIPLLTWTSWLYEPFYVGVFLVATAGFTSRPIFHRALACVAANQVVASVLHVAIPAQYPRPTLPTPAPDLSTAFLALIYRIDPPGNVFPSLHVAHTFVIAFLLRRDRPTLGAVTLVMASVLALSTLTTKQHFIADVIAGLFMALVGRAVALRTL